MSDMVIESFALMFHSSLSNGSKRHTSVASHPVVVRDNQFVIGAGKNISSEDQARIANILIESLDTSLTMFPETVLARSLDSLVWYRPAKPALMRLMLDGEVVEITRNVPSLIFKLSQGSLSVACYKGKTRPKSSTALYHAPFGNIDPLTHMCVGSNHLPRHPNLQDMDYVERMFFESEFTSLRNDNAIKKVRTWPSMVSFWQGLEKKTFPMGVLSPIKSWGSEKARVEDWIEE